MRISHELTIRSPPESVFRWIEDPALASRWQPEVVEYEVTKTIPGVVGTEFRELLGGAGGRLEMRGRVTAYVPNVMMAFDLEGRGVHVRARYALSPTSTGTRLRIDTDVRLGGCLSFLVEPWARRRMTEQVGAEAERLRKLCEGDAG